MSSIVSLRSELASTHAIGLTEIYNRVEDGAFENLGALHRRLDEVVSECYGWPASIARDADEVNRRLLLLNQKITAGEIPYEPFGAS